MNPFKFGRGFLSELMSRCIADNLKSWRDFCASFGAFSYSSLKSALRGRDGSDKNLRMAELISECCVSESEGLIFIVKDNPNNLKLLYG